MIIQALWWGCLIALLMYSAIGAVRLRVVTGPRYTRFIYSCALGPAVLFMIAGDWVWSVVWIPPALGMARLMARWHDADVARRSGQPPAV